MVVCLLCDSACVHVGVGRVATATGADVRKGGGGWHSGKGWEVRMDVPNQHVLERTSVIVSRDAVQLRFTVGLPARGRSVCGQWAASILTDVVPTLVRSSALHAALDGKALQAQVWSVEDQDSLRRQVVAAGLVAFIGNGSLLPRLSGADERVRPCCGASAMPVGPVLAAN